MCTRPAFKSYKISTQKGKNRKSYCVFSQLLFFVKQGAGYLPSSTPSSPHRTPPERWVTSRRQVEKELKGRKQLPTVSEHGLPLHLPNAKEPTLSAWKGVKK